MTSDAYSKQSVIRKCIPWLVLLALCLAYLVIDWSLLRLNQSGGFLPRIKQNYRSEFSFFIFYPLPDYTGLETKIEVANEWRSTGWWPYEMYFFEPAQAFPLWAPIRIHPPKLLLSRDMLDLNRDNLTPDSSAIQSAITAAAKLDQPGRDYVINALNAYQHPNRLYWPGIARNALAIFVALLLLFSLARIGWLCAYHVKLIKRMKSGRCQCGYQLNGLTSPTCPECGRTIAATPAQQSTTLDP